MTFLDSNYNDGDGYNYSNCENINYGYNDNIQFGANPSSLGEIRMSSGNKICSRNASNYGNIDLLGTTYDDDIKIGSNDAYQNNINIETPMGSKINLKTGGINVLEINMSEANHTSPNFNFKPNNEENKLQINENGIGFLGATPIDKQKDYGHIINNTGKPTMGSIKFVSSTNDDDTINNNFSILIEKVNSIRKVLKDFGLIE